MFNVKYKLTKYFQRLIEIWLYLQVWELFPEMKENPENALFPKWNRLSSEFPHPGERQFRLVLGRLFRQATKNEWASSLSLCRHVLQTRVAKGDIARTEAVGALLNHSVGMALQSYDLSRRRHQRREGLNFVLHFLRAEVPSEMRVPGHAIKSGLGTNILRTSSPLPRPPFYG